MVGPGASGQQLRSVIFLPSPTSRIYADFDDDDTNTLQGNNNPNGGYLLGATYIPGIFTDGSFSTGSQDDRMLIKTDIAYGSDSDYLSIDSDGTSSYVFTSNSDGRFEGAFDPRRSTTSGDITIGSTDDPVLPIPLRAIFDADGSDRTYTFNTIIDFETTTDIRSYAGTGNSFQTFMWDTNNVDTDLSSGFYIREVVDSVSNTVDSNLNSATISAVQSQLDGTNSDLGFNDIYDAFKYSWSIHQYDTDGAFHNPCLLYTSPSPRDRTRSRMPSSA